MCLPHGIVDNNDDAYSKLKPRNNRQGTVPIPVKVQWSSMHEYHQESLPPTMFPAETIPHDTPLIPSDPL